MGKNIAIIGVGNLGRRHLQSMAELPEEEYQLYAVEVVEEALLNLKKEFGDRVTFCREISGLPKEIDAVVIATSSNTRRMVFEQLTEHSDVKNVVFEKVLFQRKEDYAAVAKILKNKGIKAWVNCGRREQFPYQELKKELTDAKTLAISISGGDWGLGCNGIHMLDLVQYLSESRECVIESANLVDGVVPSKRKGFYEIHGSLSGHCGRCAAFQIECIKDSKLPIQVGISTEDKRYLIAEGQGTMRTQSADNDWNWEEKEFHMLFQSQMTKKLIEEIIETGTCELATYDESMELHLKFMEPLLAHFEKCGMEVGLCPIT